MMTRGRGKERVREGWGGREGEKGEGERLSERWRGLRDIDRDGEWGRYGEGMGKEGGTKEEGGG